MAHELNNKARRFTPAGFLLVAFSRSALVADKFQGNRIWGVRVLGSCRAAPAPIPPDWPRPQRLPRVGPFLLASVGNMPLPIACEVQRLAALHRERRYAAYLIAIGDVALILPP
jgi:hypothetical protein